MKKPHSIKTKIVLLAIVPMLLISVTLLIYAFVGGIMNTNSALTDSMSETAKISAQAITNRLAMYETAVNEAASNELFQSSNSSADVIMDFLDEVKERNGFQRIGFTDENGVNQNGSDFSERAVFQGLPTNAEARYLRPLRFQGRKRRSFGTVLRADFA